VSESPSATIRNAPLAGTAGAAGESGASGPLPHALSEAAGQARGSTCGQDAGGEEAESRRDEPEVEAAGAERHGRVLCRKSVRLRV